MPNKNYGKKVTIINRGPRSTPDETQTVIDGIPALKGLFHRMHNKFELSGKIDSAEVKDKPEYDPEAVGDVVGGMMYLSRLHSGVWGGQKKLSDYEEKNMHAQYGGRGLDGESNSVHGVDELGEGEDSFNGVKGSVAGAAAGAAGGAIGQNLSISSSAEANAKLLKRRRIALSLATLASKPEKHETIIREGAISAISELSQINDVIIHKSCASAFSLLANSESLRRAMLDQQALAALLNLALIPNKLVRLECCKALTNLMCVDGFESRSVRDGLPYTLLKIVPEDEDDLEIVLMCFMNLTCVSDKYTRIEEVTDGLLTLCTTKTMSPKLESYVIKGLANLSALKGFQQRLLEEGAMTILEKAMKQLPDSDRILAGTVVRNLTTCYRTRPKLLDHNIIAMLVNMSRDALGEVKFLAVKALYNLSRDGSCRERIVGGNAVTVILKISRETGGNIAIGRLAAKTLRVLCGDPSVANKLVGDGIVKALMSLLRNDDPSIQQYCAESICSLFQIDAVLGKLVEQGAVGVIVSLSQSSTEFITGEWCSFALYYLATNPQCPEDTLQQAILPCLIKLCKNSSSRAKYFCSSAFAFITLLKDIDTSEAIDPLVNMLQSVDEDDTKNNCITSLYNSADVDENCSAMLEAGVLEPLLELTSSNNVQTRIECAAILCRLSLQTSYYGEFEKANVLKILLDLSSLDHILTQRRVVISLSNLSADDRLRRQLFKLDPIPYIIPLAAKRDENLRRGCVSIVCNLSSEYGTEQQIVEAGIIETLLITAMISSDQLQTKVICVKALINLMADPTQYTAMVKAGAVWSFSVLATQDDTDLLQMCARALCCLSAEFADKMLESNATVKTAMYLIQQRQDLELQRLGGRTLSNLLLEHAQKGYEAKDIEFRSHVVRNMHPLAENGDDECGEMTIGILCALSQFDDCKEGIVSSGMLRKVDAGSIFASKALSISYLTMFGNIASDETMRTKILNDKTLDKFRSMCFVEDPFIELTVVKTVYSLACAKENLPTLSENTIQLLFQILNSSNRENMDLVKHMVYIIYNLSTANPEDLCKLVSNGVMDFIWDLWPEICEDPKVCKLACHAVLHLGCGNVNTSRMVEDKCTRVLTFISDKKNREKYNFSYYMLYRVSACMRNMLCVNANQKAMVSQGCILSLMEIAHEAERTAHIADPITETVQTNCSAALRSLTYNVEVRDVLKDQGAIDFIMAELSKEDTSFKYELLVEVEAESWGNGARGTNRDGRAAHIECEPIFGDVETDFAVLTAAIKGAGAESGGEYSDDDAHIGVTGHEVGHAEGVQLLKYHVKVTLDEPEIEASEYNKVLTIGINELETIVDPEENASPVTCLCPKMSCSVEAYPLRTLKLHGAEKQEPDPSEEEAEQIMAALNAEEYARNQQNLPDLNRPSSSKTERGGASGGGSYENGIGRGGKIPEIVGSSRPNSKGNFPAILNMPGLINVVENAPLLKPTGSNSVYSGGSCAMERAMNGTGNNGHTSDTVSAGGSSISWGNGESQEIGGSYTHSKKPNNGGTATRRRGPKPETPQDRFDKLVDLIKTSKKTRGQVISVEQVVDKWTEISRF